MEENLVHASDGRLALKIKPHTLRKLNVLEYYLAEITTAMRPKSGARFEGFKQRNYIDLFAGPGRCVVSGQVPSGLEVDGSPLIALKVKHPFSSCHFVDNDPKSIEALAQRVATTAGAGMTKTRFYLGDSNIKVSEILQDIDKNHSINLALIDSFSVACKWSTVKALASCKRMDFIVNFPEGMSINRNLHQWAEEQPSPLDDFFPNKKWRDIYQQAHGIASRCIRGFLDLYEEGSKELGYRTGGVREILIRSQKGAKLYYLLFASRNELGDKFWNNAAKMADGLQLRMFD